jgi:hypothetical protein
MFADQKLNNLPQIYAMIADKNKQIHGSFSQKAKG